MQAHSNRYRLVYIQTQINNPHDLNTTLKQFSEVKDMFWVSFCFVVSVFRLHKMAILLASASSPPGILCGSQHSPQQLGDALHHQQMPGSPKELINPSTSQQWAVLTCPSLEREKPGRIFSLSSAWGPYSGPC